MSGATERRRRADKQKDRLAEVEKPRGYERGLDLQEIVGATDYTGKLMFLVRWHTCDELDLLPAKEVNDKSPQDVIDYYEQRCQLNRKARERHQPNIPITQKDPPPPIVSKVENTDDPIDSPDE